MDVKIQSLKVFSHHIEIQYQIDNQYTSLTRIVYHDVDLFALEEKHPKAFLNKLFAFIALIECFKFIPLFPETIDLRVFGPHFAESVFDRLSRWIPALYSQHLYENSRSDYKSPQFIFEATGGNERLEISSKEERILCPNGGGKDSYLVAQMLSEAGIGVSSFSSARSEYGKLRFQHEIQERNLVGIKNLQNRHQVSVYDDITDWMWIGSYFPEVTGECSLGRPNQVGTPEMIFYALPVVLAHGYTGIAMGWERSAEAVQARFKPEQGGQSVNHQFLKSYEAEIAYQEFLKCFLIPNLPVFSLLRPLYDHKIFNLLGKYLEIVPFTHSCNVQKPWCCNCPKCAYVWINYVSRFDFESVDKIFGTNLLDNPSLTFIWRQLLGLEETNAFECVGHFDETRLAFKITYLKGLRGKAMDMFIEELLPQCDASWQQKTEQKFGQVFSRDSNIPERILNRVCFQ